MTLEQRAKALGLVGLSVRWSEWGHLPWVAELVAAEEAERGRRSEQRRIRDAKLGRYKALADYDWAWPRAIDRPLVEELHSCAFTREGINVVIRGPNGVGKTMIAKNFAASAVRQGLTVRFLAASALLNDLAAAEGARSLERRLKKYAGCALLVVDEVGYLSYDARYADLLFELVRRRHDLGRSIVLTTNKAFAEWSEVFPNAASVVALVDRLIHRSETIKIDADSYRLKENRDRQEAKVRRGQPDPA
jgi:DNA replication protein DnaC